MKVWIVKQDGKCNCHLNYETTIENTIRVPSGCKQISAHPTHDMVTGGGEA